jgi:uncharacterized membrane protein YoaK (UPF0700 family)
MDDTQGDPSDAPERPAIRTGIYTTRSGAQPWLYAGGAFLAGLAGYVNAVSLVAVGLVVSHLSGSASNLGADLVLPHKEAEAWPFAVILTSFFFGAASSGALLGSADLRPGRRYGFALILESGALFLGTRWLLAGDALTGAAALAFAMGLQNAMATTYRGLVLRTTHITGIVTDLGVMTGHIARREKVAGWRFVLLVSLFLGFAGGAVLGTMMFRWIGTGALWFPAGATLAAGVGYFLWRAGRAGHLWREL